MKIAVVTDSTAYLSPEEAKEYGIHVVPVPIIFGQEVFLEGVNISDQDFYQKLKGNVFPTSSQPNMGSLINLFEELAKDYQAAIFVCLSSGISGTYQSLMALSQQLSDVLPIYPIDSEITCAPMGKMAKFLASLAKTDKYTPEELIALLQPMIGAEKPYFVVDDLSNLQRGGRLSAGAALVGSLLKIKPILTFEDKKIVVFEKIRTQSKAVKRIEQIMEAEFGPFQGKGYELTIIHANCLDQALEYQAYFQELYPQLSISISHFGPVVGTHLGQGALCFTWDKELSTYFPD